MKRGLSIDLICFAIILLFVYAALSKLFQYNTYVFDLGRQPLLVPYAKILAPSIPIAELLIAALLLVPGIRLWGLLGAVILMLLFTGYVSVVVFGSNGHDLPCTCGGLIRELSWRQHFFFNILFTAIAASGLRLYYKTYMQ